MGETSLNSRQWQDAPDVLSVDDVAFLLNLDTSTVYRKAKSGELPRMNLSRVRFDKQTLREFLTGSVKTEKNQVVKGDLGLIRKELKLCR